MAVNVQIKTRQMLHSDIVNALKIEELSFSEPWSKQVFVEYLNQRKSFGIVAESDNDMIGFALYDLLDVSIFVASFAVHPMHRRCGVGTKLFNKLHDKLKIGGRESINTCVKETNLVAQLFLKSQGFICDAIIDDIYANGELGYHFEKFLST